MKCTQCGKTIEDGSDFCYYCGAVFNNEKMSKVIVEETSEEQPQRKAEKKIGTEDRRSSQKQDVTPKPNPEKSTSGVGKAIEVISVIVMIIGFIASIVLMSTVSVPVGLGSVIGTLLLGLMTFGFGRIICLLTAINAKIK